MFGYTNRKNSDIQGVAGLAVPGCEGPSTMVKSPLLESKNWSSSNFVWTLDFETLDFHILWFV